MAKLLADRDPTLEDVPWLHHSPSLPSDEPFLYADNEDEDGFGRLSSTLIRRVKLKKGVGSFAQGALQVQRAPSANF